MIYGSAPTYLNTLIQTHDTPRLLCFSKENCLALPPPQAWHSRLLSSMVSPWWNDLPSATRAKAILSTFKKFLNYTYHSLPSPLTPLSWSKASPISKHNPARSPWILCPPVIFHASPSMTSHLSLDFTERPTAPPIWWWIPRWYNWYNSFSDNHNHPWKDHLWPTTIWSSRHMIYRLYCWLFPRVPYVLMHWSQSTDLLQPQNLGSLFIWYNLFFNVFLSSDLIFWDRNCFLSKSLWKIYGLVIQFGHIKVCKDLTLSNHFLTNGAQKNVVFLYLVDSEQQWLCQDVKLLNAYKTI